MLTHAQHLQALMAGLRRALLAIGDPAAEQVLRPLADKGLAHDHVQLGDSPRLARIPKQSQMGLAPEPNLAYQSACFERASTGGHTPRLWGVLAPGTDLPWGALVVELIQGRPARLPGDLPAMARAFASIHALSMPAADAQAPLLAPADPLAALHEDIAAQWHVGRSVVLAPATRAAIESGLARLQRGLQRAARPPRCLIAFDGHPGNFIVEANGRAVLVDLEKCRYGYPALDLAHATLYTSTTWDLETRAHLDIDSIVGFHQTWADAVGPLAAQVWPSLVPLREAMWLWSLTWCAKWLALSHSQAKAVPAGEDWSHENSDAGLIAHVSERVHHYLAADTVQMVLREFDDLAQAITRMAPAPVGNNTCTRVP